MSPSQFFLANVYAERLAGTPLSPAPQPWTPTARPATTSGQDRRRDEIPVAAAR